MNIKEVKQLIDYVNKSDLTEVKWQLDNESITIRKEKELVIGASSVAPAALPVQAAAPAAPAAAVSPEASESAGDNLKTVTSPMVGTYYSSPSPEAPAFIKVGDTVKKGQTLCILEAMKIMNEVEAEFDCKIVEILVKDGDPVEYDMPIFTVEKI